MTPERYLLLSEWALGACGAGRRPARLAAAPHSAGGAAAAAALQAAGSAAWGPRGAGAGGRALRLLTGQRRGARAAAPPHPRARPPRAQAVAYVARRLWRHAAAQLAVHRELRAASERLWRLATQGAEAAGALPADLGSPDEHGVFEHRSGGAALFLRQGAGGRWECSADRALWIPAAAADSLWTHRSPSPADQVLLRRLVVESTLAGGGGGGAPGGGCAGAGAAAALPPLELEAEGGGGAAAARDAAHLASVPAAFLCPLSMAVMTQPVVSPSGGSFDRPALMAWIRRFNSDPLTGAPLRSDQVAPNLALRDLIHAWASGCELGRGLAARGAPAPPADGHADGHAAAGGGAAKHDGVPRAA
ncbi:PUB24 [Scenedesmus sp. PABB004]|nr:PUB24 [Scenedesmus sp. PABB004]